MKNSNIDILKRFDIGVRRGVAKALSKHKRLGQPIVVSQNGEIVKIAPEDIKVPPYPDDSELE